MRRARKRAQIKPAQATAAGFCFTGLGSINHLTLYQADRTQPTNPAAIQPRAALDGHVTAPGQRLTIAGPW